MKKLTTLYVHFILCNKGILQSKIRESYPQTLLTVKREFWFVIIRIWRCWENENQRLNFWFKKLHVNKHAYLIPYIEVINTMLSHSTIKFLTLAEVYFQFFICQCDTLRHLAKYYWTLPQFKLTLIEKLGSVYTCRDILKWFSLSGRKEYNHQLMQ